MQSLQRLFEYLIAANKRAACDTHWEQCSKSCPIALKSAIFKQYVQKISSKSYFVASVFEVNLVNLVNWIWSCEILQMGKPIFHVSTCCDASLWIEVVILRQCFAIMNRLVHHPPFSVHFQLPILTSGTKSLKRDPPCRIVILKAGQQRIRGSVCRLCKRANRKRDYLN